MAMRLADAWLVCIPLGGHMVTTRLSTDMGVKLILIVETDRIDTNRKKFEYSIGR